MAAGALPDGGLIMIGPDGAGRTVERVTLTPGTEGQFSEAWLQRLIHEHSECLPFAEIDPALDKFSAICREMPVRGGYIDNLLMTGSGDVAIVEAKLYRNPEARRKVLAQALDYATCLFEMGFESFERAALEGDFAPSVRPGSLHDALPEADKLPEGAFVDAVSSNLRRGRVTILIVGDGIRSETESLLLGLQAHARSGFAIALIELGFYRIGEPSGYIVVPRTLAKTEIVQRTIVEVRSDLVYVVKEETPAVPETIGIQNYWAKLEAKVPGARVALERLVLAAEPFGVYPEFLKSLNLKWARPDQKPVNLGYINQFAAIWTDAAAWWAPRELAYAYVQEVARAFDSEVHLMPREESWTLYRDGKPLRLASVIDRLEAWLLPMERFIKSIIERDTRD